MHVSLETVDAQTGETSEVVAESELTGVFTYGAEVEPGSYMLKVAGTDDEPATGTIVVKATTPEEAGLVME
ncbi:hypothetical protein [Slackia heliotrinireducens]|uniref:Uncharacterized protein n=1 Tax=Slackia heliotrinireducens (strain ATCC 29202 / DSM 20476 / NCTC 11029 / RHS 1) TaxID=471855 RepID=C7N5E2_SLAHD|nr:hypothetical protein [Slackia heliotrinireducens]ACV22127.1 hypothetical protein Shel_10920 [Slackia heliotrinireducens DSM 20476]VEH00157.1 Uncharacterised protein [Slackia heliotrinireducens]